MPNHRINFPLAVAADGRGFVDADGHPFFWLGDTAWPLLTLYPIEQAKAYISRRAEQGYTVIQSVFTWPGADPSGAPVPDDEAMPGVNDRGHTVWVDGDPGTADAAYLDDCDELLAHAESVGVALLVIGYWGNYVVERGMADADAAYRFGHALGARLKDRANLLWMNGGDRVPTGYEEVWNAYARGVRDAGARQLMTYHPTGAHSSSYWWHDTDWLDFNFVQSWGSWARVSAMIAADRALDPAKPTVMGEPAYEDGPEYPTGPITPAIVRRQAAWAWFAGGGFSYGQNLAWRMGEGWFESIESPGAIQLGRMRAILESRPWSRMTPDLSILLDGAGHARTGRAALRTRDRRHWLIYLPECVMTAVCIDRVAAARVRATWIDPRTGEETEAGVHETQNEQGIVYPLFEDPRAFTPPRFFEDAILALDAVE